MPKKQRPRGSNTAKRHRHHGWPLAKWHPGRVRRGAYYLTNSCQRGLLAPCQGGSTGRTGQLPRVLLPPPPSGPQSNQKKSSSLFRSSKATPRPCCFTSSAALSASALVILAASSSRSDRRCEAVGEGPSAPLPVLRCRHASARGRAVRKSRWRRQGSAGRKRYTKPQLRQEQPTATTSTVASAIKRGLDGLPAEVGGCIAPPTIPPGPFKCAEGGALLGSHRPPVA
mmetsp:Transcript_19037/g.43227  ORF Transcript_19037/g.43227 Transcript_19037/m.43227 type:complete len:227 (+) Transcript_19037:51-731(+)